MNKSPYISFLGPDGSGKSTIIAALEEQLDSNGIDYHYHHWCVRLSGPIRPGGNVISEPHDQALRGIIGSCLQLIYRWLLALPAWFRWVRPARKKGIWVILDRGPMDLLVDGQRHRNSAPRWIRKLWVCLQPSTSHVFVLTAPPEILYKRKPEIPLHDLGILVEKYRSLRGGKVTQISVDRPVKEIMREILEQLELKDE